MKESILSVGIDLGTTTTQMVVSRLQLENTASPFSVPNMEISQRQILYESDIFFTPLLSSDTLDTEQIKQIIRSEYRKAGIEPSMVQTGAVIITGETARKENARQVLQALSELAGSFVVATAGPALESVLAARGAGADRYAKDHGVYVLHFDIGGGTSNLALFDPDGNLADTGCLNVGGRLLKMNADGVITYVSPVLQEAAVGQKADEESLSPMIEMLVTVLEQAAGLREPTQLLQRFITDKTVSLPHAPVVFSFSGGVADLIRQPKEDWLCYGDIGVLLGKAIRASRLCGGAYIFGRHTLRATVVGAGSHATELSGSTVTCSGAVFPIQDLPAVCLTEEEGREEPQKLAQTIRRKAAVFEGQPVALAMKGLQAPDYGQILRYAEAIANGLTARPIVVALECDMAKALGQALRCRLGADAPIVCLDGLCVPQGSYLDVASPVAGGTAVPVVIKTLAFS